MQAEGLAQAKLYKLGMTGIFRDTEFTSWSVKPSARILLRRCQVRHKFTSSHHGELLSQSIPTET